MLNDTQNDIDKATREKVVEILAARLSDAVDLMLQTKYAHWNVKGASFIALHELFDEVAERVEEHCDLIAERVVALGGRADGTTRLAASRSAIAEYELAAVDGEQHVRALSRQVAALAASIRLSIQAAADAGDPTTSDLFTEVSRALDKDLWFLEAHLQGK